MKEITLLLVDDEPQVRRGLRMRLELQPDVRIVGEAGDGRTAVELANELSPRVVLMDVELPVMDGVSAASQIVARNSAVAVVMLSMHDDAATIQRARDAGATDFVAKHRMDDGLLEAIRRAARREGSPACENDSSNPASDRRARNRRK
jgi:DNA-binding NarL/FixJ family response regulator